MASGFDVVIGIPSLNSEKTIGFVVEQVDLGLQKYFPKMRCLVVCSDGGSTDGTREAFEGTETVVEKLFVRYSNPVPGKGSALKKVWEIGLKHNAEFFAVFDSDLRSILPEWVQAMVSPLLKGIDFCTPYYIRHKYDASITNHVCFPCMYGLFCCNIRQPIGGEFSFNSPLVNHWLKKADWASDIARFGVDIFMTCNAVLNGFNVRQVFLGEKVHEPKEPASLRPMFEQVVGTLFEIALREKSKWVKLQTVKRVPVLGIGGFAEPPAVRVSKREMLEGFLRGREELRSTWAEVLSQNTFDLIDSMDRPRIDSRLWSRIVFDFAAAFQENKGVLKAMAPLWLARNLSFVEETTGIDCVRAEALVEEQAKAFYRARSYLIEKLN